MATTWVISDTHFGHATLLGFRRPDGSPVRDFASAEEMDEHMVERWNSVVRDGDHVYHLGDVAIQRRHLATVRRLKGKKRLVLGNHDIFGVKDYVQAGFQKVFGSRVLDGWLMTHIPVNAASLGRFRGNVHGHIHASPCHPGPYANVCVEAVGYTPVALESLPALLKP